MNTAASIKCPHCGNAIANVAALELEHHRDEEEVDV